MTVHGLRYCPSCTGALELRPLGEDGSRHPACVQCGFVLWQNPKPCVDALIMRASGAVPEVLLGRRAVQPSAGHWDTPGDFLNVGDQIEEALIRACRREMNVEVVPIQIIGAFDDMAFGMHIISLAYLCDFISGEPRPAGPIDEARWFRLSETPPVSFSSVERALAVLRVRMNAD